MFATVLLVGGCAGNDSRIARRAEAGLLGFSEIDLETCLGVPNRRDKLDQTTILSYDGASTSSGGITLTLPVIGGLSFSGGGFCHLAARLDRGRVTSIRFTGETDAPFAPEAYCAPLVRSCLAHPPANAPVTISTEAARAGRISPANPPASPNAGLSE